MPSRLLGRGARVAASWRAEERDAVLYAAAALFAIVTAQASSISLYRQWGWLAVGPYTLGALASAVSARRARHRAAAAEADGDGPAATSTTWHWTTSRTVILLVVFVGATLGPLALEVLWQTDSGGTSHVQPEALVVEGSGSNLAHGKPLYRVIDGRHERISAPPGQPAYDVYNPYLPLMSLFGLPSSTKAPRRLTDARVVFSLITILVVVAALALCRGPTGPRVLALQAMTVFPTAALPLATGGDDVPIAALLLLGLILLQRRRPLAAGIILGIAASMKITAWPLALLALLVATDRDGNRGRRPSLTFVGGLALVMVPSILPTFVGNPAAFIDNVVRFPLGLAGITSPASSPLLGHAIVSWFPGIHRLFTVVVAAVGGIVLLFVLVRHRPRTAADLSRLLGWVMTIAILVAPATRIGYLLYPIDFFIFSWLLRSEDVGSPMVSLDEPARHEVAIERDVPIIGTAPLLPGDDPVRQLSTPRLSSR
ncbi:MAG TPA: glycosyltransferase 87 family protein [Acidimicrobiales bacterium]|nr:glycosyltransferase 87 family protein [Acidimicrobiales bacterium]